MNATPLHRCNDGKLQHGPRFLIVRLNPARHDCYGTVVATARHLEIAWDLQAKHSPAIIIDKAHDQVLSPRPTI
jgi:hypothetical protein